MSTAIKMLLIVLSASILSVLLFFVVAGHVMPSNNSTGTKADRFLVIKGSRMRYALQDRPGMTAIMLHGFGGDHTVWNRLSVQMSGARIFALDLVGFGLSGAPRIRYDLKTQAEYVIEFMNHLNIDRAVFVGASMGASVALWTASHFPARVSGVIAFAPSGIKGSMRHGWPGNLLYRPNIINKITRLILAIPLYRLLFPRSLALQALDSSAAYDESFEELLSLITQPVLLIWARGDRRVPFPMNIYYRRLIPHAEFVEAPKEEGHSAYRNPTLGIVEAINSFMSRVGKSGRRREEKGE